MVSGLERGLMQWWTLLSPPFVEASWTLVIWWEQQLWLIILLQLPDRALPLIGEDRRNDNHFFIFFCCPCTFLSPSLSPPRKTTQPSYLCPVGPGFTTLLQHLLPQLNLVFLLLLPGSLNLYELMMWLPGRCSCKTVLSKRSPRLPSDCLRHFLHSSHISLVSSSHNPSCWPVCCVTFSSYVHLVQLPSSQVLG